MDDRVSIYADKIIHICEELKVLLSNDGAFDTYKGKLLGKLQRLALQIGTEEREDGDAVERFRARREARLNGRVDEDEERHGNTRIPFGLCKQEGIEIDPNWTPRDAWAALAEKGYSVALVYEDLRENGCLKGSKRDKAKKIAAKVAHSLSTEEDEAVFYSGCGEKGGEGKRRRGSDDVANEYAANNGGKTMNMLLSGEAPDWNDMEDDPLCVWEEVSKIYARNAKGNVRVLVRPPLRDGNIFENVELPELKKNPNVRKITVIDMDTGEEKEIYRRGK